MAQKISSSTFKPVHVTRRHGLYLLPFSLTLAIFSWYLIARVGEFPRLSSQRRD